MGEPINPTTRLYRLTPIEAPMNERPLQPLEELILESLNPRAIRERFGLPHPLSKFAPNGKVKEGPHADAILASIHDLTWQGPDSAGHRAARWLLFESELAFFRACAEAGIDAEKLRSHLRSRSITSGECCGA